MITQIISVSRGININDSHVLGRTVEERPLKGGEGVEEELSLSECLAPH